LQVLGILVHHQPGVLSRVAGVFGRRGFNIDSLVVGPCADPGFARMNVCLDTDEVRVVQLLRHLSNLVDVVAAEVVPVADRICEELAMIRVQRDPAHDGPSGEIAEAAAPLGGRVVHADHAAVMVQVVGDTSRVEELIDVLGGYGIVEMIRTGPLALSRHENALSVSADERCRGASGV